MSANDRKRSAKAANDGSISPAPDTDSDNESLPEIQCNLCDKDFISYNAYQQHIKSKKHLNQMTQRKMTAKAAIDKLVDEQLSESDDDDDKYTELNCGVCSKTFSGYKPYASHLHGSTHAKNVKKQALKLKMKDVPGIVSDEGSDDDYMPKTVAKCKLCEKDFTSLDSFQKHLSGSMHKKKLQQEKIFQKLKDEHKESDGEMQDDFYKKCEVCGKEFSGLVNYQVHMQSLVHKKALKRREMADKIKDMCTKDSTDKNYICKECEHVFLDPFAFQLHLDNNSHKKYETKKQITDIVDSHPEIVALKTIQSNPVDTDDQGEYEIGDYILVCKLCHNSFSGPQSALDHVKSKKHVKAKQDRAAIKILRGSQKKKAPLQDDSQAAKKSANGTEKDSSGAKVLNGATNYAEEEDDFEHV